MSLDPFIVALEDDNIICVLALIQNGIVCVLSRPYYTSRYLSPTDTHANTHIHIHLAIHLAVGHSRHTRACA